MFVTGIHASNFLVPAPFARLVWWISNAAQLMLFAFFTG
jgi:hypothetical protein